jgi:hypothetical protein
MTGTDQSPLLPDPYRNGRGVGDPGGSASTWDPEDTPPEPPSGGAWENWAIFAAVVLLLAGFGHVLLGIVALLDASNSTPGESDPPLGISFTAWGWFHVFGGALLLAAGGAIMARKAWGRFVAIAFAAVNAVGALGVLSSDPFRGALLIAMDVMIVYALTVHAAANTPRPEPT